MSYQQTHPSQHHKAAALPHFSSSAPFLSIQENGGGLVSGLRLKKQVLSAVFRSIIGCVSHRLEEEEMCGLFVRVVECFEDYLPHKSAVIEADFYLLLASLIRSCRSLVALLSCACLECARHICYIVGRPEVAGRVRLYGPEAHCSGQQKSATCHRSVQ